MALPANLSAQDLTRLLELFPLKSLKEEWPDKKGTKEDLCKEIAKEKDLGRIADFVDKSLNLCKQNVYVFDIDPLALPAMPTVTAKGWVKKVGKTHAMYLIRVQFKVVLRDPFEETTIDFAWPFTLDLVEKYLVLRFIVLEKNIATYFQRPFVKGVRNIDEQEIIESLKQNNKLKAVDLNKGVKKQWSSDVMDARRTHYKKPTSTASEAMDEERGIKKDNPELYAILMKSPLYRTLFIVPATAKRKEVPLWIDPTQGTINFPRYSETMGNTDNVIREILKKNN